MENHILIFLFIYQKFQGHNFFWIFVSSYVNVLILAQLQHTQFMCGLLIIHIQMHVILIPCKDHTLKNNASLS